MTAEMNPEMNTDMNTDPNSNAGDSQGSIWINTTPSVDGSHYLVTVEFGPDCAVTLTPARAPAYATAILEAVARAEYDAAVFNQLLGLVPDMQAASEVIGGLRQDRPGIDTQATQPLEVRPGVTAEGKPFLVVVVNGTEVGQWTLSGAREHALAALEAVLVADLDSGYHRTLVGLVGLDSSRARHVIQDIANHRDGWEPDA